METMHMESWFTHAPGAKDSGRPLEDHVTDTKTKDNFFIFILTKCLATCGHCVWVVVMVLTCLNINPRGGFDENDHVVYLKREEGELNLSIFADFHHGGTRMKMEML